MLDFWRGIAVLIVVVFHSTYYVATPELEAAVRSGNGTIADSLIVASTRLWIGVPMFFVISGFCIAAAADATRAKERSTADYFRRRVRRIYPPYWIYLVAAVLGIAVAEYYSSALFTDPHHRKAPIDVLSMPAIHAIGNITLMETWLPKLLGGGQRFWLGHAWTLCYEEQFYAVFGFALLACRKCLFEAMAAVTVVVVVIVAAGLGDAFAGFFFDGFWLDFAAGVVVYWALKDNRRNRVIATVGLLLTAFVWKLTTEGLVTFRGTAFGFAIVLLLLHRFDKMMAANRTVSLFAWIGVMCYSVYLVHFPMVRAISHWLHDAGLTTPAQTVGITLPTCIAAAVVTGRLFHVLVERRFLNSPQGLTVNGV